MEEDSEMFFSPPIARRVVKIRKKKKKKMLVKAKILYEVTREWGALYCSRYTLFYTARPHADTQPRYLHIVKMYFMNPVFCLHY